jgi:integrase
VIRRHGNRWQVTVYAGIDPVTSRERRVRGSVPAKANQVRPPKEARELEARLLLEVGAGDHREATVTVAELLEQWLAQAGPDLSPTTLHGYQRYIARSIVPRLGKVRLDKLTTAMLDHLYRELRASGGVNGKPLAPATVRQVQAVLHRALGQAERWGWVNRNPAVLASPPKLVRKEIRPPTPLEVGRILRAAHDEEPGFGLALWLAALTGARRGELCGIRWDDVDLVGGSVVIRHSVVELSHRLVLKDPKTHQIRRVALDEATVALLRTRHAIQTEHALRLGAALDQGAFVLSDDPVGSEPLHPNLLSDRFRRLVRRLGIQCRLHDLRHWHVTQALGAGLPVRDVAERVGHASATMTLDVYGHAIESADRRTAETVASVLHVSMEEGAPRREVRPRRKSPHREPRQVEHDG